jgi:hypothetical protein
MSMKARFKLGILMLFLGALMAGAGLILFLHGVSEHEEPLILIRPLAIVFAGLGLSGAGLVYIQLAWQALERSQTGPREPLHSRD